MTEDEFYGGALYRMSAFHALCSEWPQAVSLVMADELNINKETIRQILHEDLRKSKMCPKFVPHKLTDEQK
jgi:hypothetical protein